MASRGITRELVLSMALALAGCQVLIHVPAAPIGAISEDDARATFERQVRTQEDSTGVNIERLEWRTGWVDVSMTYVVGHGKTRTVRIPLKGQIQVIQYESWGCRVFLPMTVLESKDWPLHDDTSYMLYVGGGKKCEAGLRPAIDAFNELSARNSPVADPSADPEFQRHAGAWRAAGPAAALPEEARREKVLAEAAYHDHDSEGALEHYVRALRIEPAWPDGNFNAAFISGELGDFEGAIRFMKRYLALVPSGKDSAAARDKIIIWEDRAKRGR